MRKSGSSKGAPPAPPLTGDTLAQLLPLVREVSSVLDPEALLPTIARQLKRIIDYRFLDIFLPQDDGSLAPAFVDGIPVGSVKALRLRPGEGIVGAAALLREPVFVPDVRKDPRYIPVIPGVAAELAIPLLHRDRLVGVLNVEGMDGAAFTPDAIAALRVLAGHLATAIENATLYRETRWYAGLLATLYEIGKETSSILDLNELLARVAEVVKRVIDYEMFAILLLDEERKELVARKTVRYGSYPEKQPIKVGEGLCGTAALFKEPILVGDVRKDPRYLNLIPETRSELVVPLVYKDRCVGVFDLESTVLDRFNEEHVKILTPLAAQVAVAIENARLYEDIRLRELRVKRELEIAQQIQHGLFPEEAPRGKGWEASAHFCPARELGGDLYDFFDIAEDVLGVAVGDVAGKGVPAALYGAFASGTVRARAFQRRGPAELLAGVNRTLRRRGVEGIYCTLGYALFDFQAKTVRVANSGLPYPLHYRASTGLCEPITLGGLPLGTFDASSYEEVVVSPGSGDLFLLYTDGVSEAWNGHEAFGVERLRQLVVDNARAPDIGGRIVAAHAAFMAGAEAGDDFTLVVIRVL
ncbi:MAG TPA: GAF domain-containing protein [Vicinamibacteria bacterium]|nr:GAF domain-containing protein [Vicinamibacteria bacterium]